MPNSGSMLTMSPSVNTNCDRRSFLHVRTIAICCAATDSAANSIRLNSSKQPHDPDIDRPASHTSVAAQRTDCTHNWQVTYVAQLTGNSNEVKVKNENMKVYQARRIGLQKSKGNQICTVMHKVIKLHYYAGSSASSTLSDTKNNTLSLSTFRRQLNHLYFSHY